MVANDIPSPSSITVISGEGDLSLLKITLTWLASASYAFLTSSNTASFAEPIS
jgi:hypothetical protein